MGADHVIELLADLDGHGVNPCVGGGWAVDALLGEQTRPHGDLDLWVRAVDLNQLLVAFSIRGLNRIQPWGDARPWNFALDDDSGLRVDLHLYEPRGDGTWHYGSALTGNVFPDVALEGTGDIAGFPVRCDAPEWSVRWHSGYPPRQVDRQDVLALCDRFRIARPPEYR